MVMKKFLIVDDDERFTRLIHKKLEKYAQCTIALSGEEALLLFEHHLNEKAPFEAIFMDIEMPEMTGHEAISKMRGIEKRKKINPLQSFKLVMLTAHKDVKNVSTSFFKGGADAYIHKESGIEKMIAELQSINLI